MKILILSDIPPFVTGGAEMQAYRLMEFWLSNGHEIICAGKNLPSTKITIPSGEIKLQKINIIKKLGRHIKAISYFFSLAIILIKHRKWQDIIYTRFLGESAIVVCLLKFLKIINPILISTPANAGNSGDVAYVKSAPCGKLLLKLINSQCDAINLIAPKMLEDMANAGIISPQITQIPNGIPIKTTCQNSQFTKENDPIFLISVGRLTPQKGYDIYLNALFLLKQSNISFKAKIIGDGPEKETLKQLIHHYELEKNIELVGEQSQEEIRTTLELSDIFVLPSRYEGMSNAALEAMTAGKPLLLTNCGGIDTYVTSSMGWVAERDSIDSLYNNLQQAIMTDRSKLSQMGIENRNFAVNKFDMQKIGKLYLQLFEKLIFSKRLTK